jgi:Putative metallopeptidase
MGPTYRSADVRMLPGALFFRHRRASSMAQARAPLLNFMRSAACLLSAMCISLIVMAQTPTAAADAQTNRIRIEYYPPNNPALQPVYQLVKERRVLEKLQQIFSPFVLPIDLTFKTGDCGGVSNAWYDRPAVSICYEYLNEIYQSVSKEPTPEGITPADAVFGQFFYVVAHEMGHAMFDILQVPVFGNGEDAADHFSVYIMLQFGKDQSRPLILGAAHSYKKYLQSSEVTAPLAAFSDVHAPPAQRFYNLICLAYGAHATLFADVVDKGYLPKERASSCKREYDQVAVAFRDLIVPHLDQQLARQVLDKTWLPDVTAPAAQK